MTAEDNARELLQRMCAQLRQLRDQAGGPSFRALAERVKVGKTQVGAILSGQIRQPPDWHVVRAMLDSILRHAAEHDRAAHLALPTGIEEYWRHQYAIVEHAFAQQRHRGAAPSVEPTATATPGDPAAAAPATPVKPELVAPRQLPRATGGFVGRAAELGEFGRLLREAGGTAAAVAVIDGPAGVGKTTLVLEWAHQVVDQFPDVQLYVNLRGFDPGGRVMASAEALHGFLEALGVAPERIPVSLDAKAALYRSLLAGKRALVVLDNARDAEQVRPLLPGTPGAMTVVTSRNELTPLVAVDGAHRVALGLMSPAEARELLATRLGAARVAAEAGSVDRIVAACARLPLALAIAAARSRTGFPLSTVADELADAGALLDNLDAGDATSQVRSVFSWSYTTLTPPAARVFRLLGLHHGPDISAPVVASLTGCAPAGVRPLLTELTRANLLAEHTPGRYTLHDLLGVYAAELAGSLDPAPAVREATARLLHHYLHTARAAEQLLHPHREPVGLPVPPPPPGTTPEEPGGHDDAMSWLAVEHPTLLAALHHAARAGFEVEAVHLAWAMDSFLKWHGHRHDRVIAWQSALDAAGPLGNPVAGALARRMLADALRRTGRHDEAHTHLRDALEIYRDAGDVAGQAYSHYHLAALHSHQGGPHEALEHAREALRLFRTAGHTRGEALALNGVGWYTAQLGDHAQTIVHCEQALVLLRQVGDSGGEAATWDSLGYANHHLGRPDRAVTCYQHAIDLYRRLGDRYYEADTLVHLGDTHHTAGRAGPAGAAWQQALDILTHLDHPDAERVRGRLQRYPAQQPRRTSHRVPDRVIPLRARTAG